MDVMGWENSNIPMIFQRGKSAISFLIEKKSTVPAVTSKDVLDVCFLVLFCKRRDQTNSNQRRRHTACSL